MDQSRVRPQTLPNLRPFTFSQASLQDYLDCARRFQLRYLQQLHWPAPQAEPVQENEAHIRRGERFHRLAEQALAGVPTTQLARAAAADPDPALVRWWDHFAALLPTLQTGKLRAEVVLSAPLNRHRLLAKYDLVQTTPDGRAIIYDWKTHLFRPKRSTLESRLQTLVYPAVLARAGAGFNAGKPFSADAIEMVYWFAEFPDRPERFSFSAGKLERDWQDLEALAVEIAALPADGFPRTEDEKRCRFCVYRSLCARGVEAGLLAESEEDPETDDEIHIDFEQVGEIGF